MATSEVLKQELFARSEDSQAFINNLIKFAQMQVALSIGDEVDKNGISLVG